MWLFLKDSFVSIVRHEEDGRLLNVRARIAGDIERLFPEADVIETPEGDHRFRASLPRERVAEAVALAARHIDYSSFLASIEDLGRLEAYRAVVHTMEDEQVRRLHEPGPEDGELGFDRRAGA